MRESGNLWQFKDITVKLANAYGYCWGVERAVQMAYEARKAYPGQKLYVTNEIIHNPAVNQVQHCNYRCASQAILQESLTAYTDMMRMQCCTVDAESMQTCIKMQCCSVDAHSLHICR